MYRKEICGMLHHYITKYTEKGKRYAEAWMQLDILGFSFCFSRRKTEVKDDHSM